MQSNKQQLRRLDFDLLKLIADLGSALIATRAAIEAAALDENDAEKLSGVVNSMKTYEQNFVKNFDEITENIKRDLGGDGQ
jgi:hypothetical protein